MTKRMPNIGKKTGAPIDTAIMVQNMPKMTAIIDPSAPIPDGPRPGLMLLICKTSSKIAEQRPVAHRAAEFHRRESFLQKLPRGLQNNRLGLIMPGVDQGEPRVCRVDGLIVFDVAGDIGVRSGRQNLRQKTAARPRAEGDPQRPPS